MKFAFTRKHALTLTGLLAAILSVVAVSGAPSAFAYNPYQYFRTQSGKVRCVVNAEWVTCEHGPGFPSAPVAADGSRPDDAKITRSGDFSWMSANIGGGSDVAEMTLYYGDTYHVNGWTVVPNVDGTRFTNDDTGHGMFVSVENVYPF